MKDKLRIALFGLILLTLSLFNILSPARAFSDRENRFLEKFPKLTIETIIDGSFNEKFQKYSGDQFVFRDNWISLKSRMDLGLLKKDNGRIYYGKDDYLFQVEETLDKSKFIKNISKINSFKKNTGIAIDLMLIPSKTTILEDKLPYKAPVNDEEKLLLDIKEELDKDIYVFSPIESFKAKKDEQIYYKTDHHYTSLGAYYAYEAYMESIGQEPYSLEYFKRETMTDDFLGSLFRKSNYYKGPSEIIEKFIPETEAELNIVKNEKDQLASLYDESFLKKSDKYSFFLGGDHPLVDIKTSLKAKGTLVLIKDSFANSLIPFLTLHYDRIIVIDKRYFNIALEDYIKDKKVDKVLYLYNIKNFYDH